MIYVTGDTHGGYPFDMKKFSNKVMRNTVGAVPSKDDYVAIMGDFGFPFFYNDAENKSYQYNMK